MASDSLGLSEREVARINAVLSGPEPARLTWWRLWIAGEERAFTDLSWDADAGSYGMSLRATVRGSKGFIDRSALGRVVELEIIVDGIPVERFTGDLLSAVEAATGASGGANSGGWLVQAASRGDALPEKEIKTRLSWDQAPPHLILFDALNRAGYTGQVTVETVEQPKITLSLGTAFSATDSLVDPLDAVAAEVPAYEFFDVPGDGHDAFLRKAPEDLGEPDFVFDAARLEGFKPERAEPRVAWVGVRREKEQPPLTEDPWEVLARAPVPGSKADDDTIEWIDTTDRSASAAENAWQTARDRAAELAERHRVSFVGPEHPLLRRGSGAWVRQKGADAAGPFSKVWAVYLDTLSGALPRKRTTYAGDCAVVDVRREPKREPVPLPATAGVARPAWGADHLGDLYGDDSFVYEDENGDLWATEDAPITETAEGELAFV